MQQSQLSRIQIRASALGSNEVMDHLQLFMKNFRVPFNFKLVNSGLGTSFDYNTPSSYLLPYFDSHGNIFQEFSWLKKKKNGLIHDYMP